MGNTYRWASYYADPLCKTPASQSYLAAVIYCVQTPQGQALPLDCLMWSSRQPLEWETKA